MTVEFRSSRLIGGYKIPLALLVRSPIYRVFILLAGKSGTAAIGVPIGRHAKSDKEGGTRLAVLPLLIGRGVHAVVREFLMAGSRPARIENNDNQKMASAVVP